MLHFCTYFDSNYLVRFLAMSRSLERHCHSQYSLHALCLDDGAFDTLNRLRLNRVIPYRLGTLEEHDPQLLATKGARGKYEYYFTLTPSWILYLLERVEVNECMVYLDSDLYFYSSLQPMFEEMENKSVVIIPHRFPPRLKQWEKAGLYNVSFVAFRQDKDGMACVRWWREKCIEWCYDRCEDGRYADQKYLDAFPSRFENVHVLRHIGANVGPWNVEQYPIRRRGSTLMMGDSPLIFYHFEGYRQETPDLIDSGLCRYDVPVHEKWVRYAHLPYIQEILKCRTIIHRYLVSNDSGGDTRWADKTKASPISRIYGLRQCLEGRYVWCFAGRGWYCESSMMKKLLRTLDCLTGRKHPGK